MKPSRAASRISLLYSVLIASSGLRRVSPICELEKYNSNNKQLYESVSKILKKEEKNYFNDYLEPLFYEALRTGEDRKHEDYYYSRFNCKIPFLNGGLFDPIGNYDWVHTDILLPNKLFSNQTKTKEGDIGTGILDVFDRYNFTVKEDEPLEKEVAIDPELLGKSYEKFNAIRPDNFDEFKKALKSGKKGEENKFNKKFGVYYTPREIVHYMCQQSLINYLHTAASTHKEPIITKPAVQKKMFGPQSPVQQTLTSDLYKPLIPKKDIEKLIHTGEQLSENEARVLSKGKETKTYSHQLPERIRKDAKLIDDKLAEITICDPAVGSGAFPVGMMSEIVKIRNVLTPFLSLRGAQATKQSQIDDNRTVYNFKRQCIEHSLYGVDIDPGAVEIAKLRLWLSLVVDEDDIKNIKPLPNLDYKIVCGNSLLGVEKNLFNFNLFNRLEKLKPLFFNETNPTKKQKYKKQIDKLINEITSGHKEFDFEVYFSEVFHHKGGFDVVIANPPYGRYTGITTLLKNKLKKHCIYGPTGDLAEFFIRNTLNNLLSECGFLTFIVPKGLSYVTSWREMRKKLLAEHNLYVLIDAGKSFDAVLYEMLIFMLQRGNKLNPKKNLTTGYLSQNTIIEMQTPRDFLTEGTFYFGFPKSYYNILKKVKLSCKPISEYVDFWYGKGGMTPHVNREERGIPVLTGKEIQRYHTVPRKDGRWYLENHFLNNNDLHRSKRQKVVIQDIVAHITRPYPHIKITAALDYDSCLCLNTVMCFSTTSKISNSFLVGLLNSTFISFYYYYFVFNQAIRTMHFMPGYADVMPIPQINIEQHDKLDFLVKKVMKEKNINSNTDVLILEREIDQLVYKLYDLTPEEIKIVEGKDDNAD